MSREQPAEQVWSVVYPIHYRIAGCLEDDPEAPAVVLDWAIRVLRANPAPMFAAAVQRFDTLGAAPKADLRVIAPESLFYKLTAVLSDFHLGAAHVTIGDLIDLLLWGTLGARINERTPLISV